MAIDYQRKLKWIQERQSDWDAIANDSIKAALEFKEYVYNTSAQKETVSFPIDSKSKETVTLSQLRTAINRIKTDLRDLQPRLKVICKKKSTSPLVKKTINTIAIEEILTTCNIRQLYKCFDNIVDLGYSVCRLSSDKHYDKFTKTIKSKIKILCVSDLECLFFDSDCPISRLNEDGRFVGSVKNIAVQSEKETEKKDYQLVEFWEKIMGPVKYGLFQDESNHTIAERYNKSKRYINIVVINEVTHINHVVFRNDEVIVDEKWPFLNFPYIINAPITVENYQNEDRKQLTLVPFAEHVQSAQKLLDYAASLHLHSLKTSIGSNKFIIPVGSVTAKDIYKRRSMEDSDLPYVPFIKEGNTVIPVKPELIVSPPLDPSIKQALEAYPTFINALLGINLEQDITYNTSGEAIRQIQKVRTKNAKLYTDSFLELLETVGGNLTEYLKFIVTPVAIEDTLKSSDSDPNSQRQLVIQTMTEIETYKMEMQIGRSRGAKNEFSLLALEKLYHVSQADPQTSAMCVKNTIDLYAQCLDSELSDEITKRLEPFVPLQTRQLSDDKITLQQIDAQNAQKQQQSQQLMQSLQTQQIKNESLKVQADHLTAEAKIVDAENKLKSSSIKAKAEVAKSFSSNKGS